MSSYPWQKAQWEYLINRLKNHNFPHSLLLAGQKGLGKNDFAQNLARTLLCESSNPNGACGNCSSCQLLNAGNHPDLYLLTATEKDKILKIDQVRDVVDQLSLKSHQGRFKVVVISPAHNLNLAASNALLKTLEEPAGDIVFILVTEHPALLPATIRSRCQLITFTVPARSVAEDWLRQNSKEDMNFELALALSDSSPLLALELNADKLRERKEFIEKFAQFCEQKIDITTFTEFCLELDFMRILQYLKSFLMDILKVKIRVAEKFIINRDQLQILQSVVDKLVEDNILLGLTKITDFLLPQNTNLNKSLFLTDLFLELIQ